MAHPIAFKPLPVDPKQELMRRVEAAPKEHADALLRAWEVLQTAHDKGLLDLVNGLMGGKDIIVGKLADAANLPESVAAIRNGMALARVLGSVDPDMLQRFAKALDDAGREKAATEQQAAMHGSASVGYRNEAQEEKPPSLWRIFRMATSADARRGIGFTMGLLTALGRATHKEE